MITCMSKATNFAGNTIRYSTVVVYLSIYTLLNPRLENRGTDASYQQLSVALKQPLANLCYNDLPFMPTLSYGWTFMQFFLSLIRGTANVANVP